MESKLERNLLNESDYLSGLTIMYAAERDAALADLRLRYSQQAIDNYSAACDKLSTVAKRSIDVSMKLLELYAQQFDNIMEGKCDE